MLNIGHRGAKGHVTENTLASFAKAIELGVHGIELDVHVCASGELVVFHDFTVDRLTNGTGEVAKLTLSELKALKLTGGFDIPTLDEVLDAFGNKCLWNIEMKGRHTAQPVSDTIERYIAEKGWEYTDLIVSSFQYEELQAMSRLNPNVPLGVLTEASVHQAWEWAQEFNAVALHPNFTLLTESNVTKAHEAGYKIYTWTVNEPADIARMKALGVDGIITDFPERV
ncbi:glycerophosphodiester phosphodiesterase [Flavobacterium sp. RHBU_3]|uniref:glycerophosphodiester phosphodiesterase n=1 Tax=Flavobacterium sp. RHBU_3 TaxID=3391184 RepID=UPI00398542C3